MTVDASSVSQEIDMVWLCWKILCLAIVVRYDSNGICLPPAVSGLIKFVLLFFWLL